jgi:4-hydroxybenzoate polyprenyltransferase
VNATTGNRVMAVMRLVRAGNLFMVALTMLMLRYLVLQKLFAQEGMVPSLDRGLFVLLVLSTLLIAAGGYIINDYFDVKTDLINRPDTVVVDRVIKRRWAIILHLIVTIAGILLGMWVSLKTGYLRLSLFHIGAAVLLWVYSTGLKKSFLAGNVAVSLLTASVAFIPLVFEMGVMHRTQPGFIFSHRPLMLHAFKISMVFAVFAFVTSMAREIIKDMEDYYGDRETGGRTMPIVWGLRAGKLVAFFLLLITDLLLLFVLYNSVRAAGTFITFSNIYITAALLIPVSILAVRVLKCESVRCFHRASVFLKLIMLAGLCYSLVYYFN